MCEKTMFYDDMAEELFKLSLRVNNETNSYASFSATKIACTVLIQDVFDDTFGKNGRKGYDGNYAIYPDDFPYQDLVEEEFEHAKAHLERLLANGRCPA